MTLFYQSIAQINSMRVYHQVTESMLSNNPQFLAKRIFSNLRRRIVINSGNQILGGVLLNQVRYF